MKYGIILLILFVVYSLNFKYFNNINILFALVIIIFIKILILLFKKFYEIFSENDFIEKMKLPLYKLSYILYFFLVIVLFFSIMLLYENNVEIFNYDLLYVQKIIGIVLFVVILMNYEILEKVEILEFNNIEIKLENYRIDYYQQKQDNGSCYILTIEKNNFSLYDKVTFFKNFDYELMAHKLYCEKFISSEDGSENSTIVNFIRFISGLEMEQQLVIIDENSRGNKSPVYSTLVILLKNLITNYDISFRKFIIHRVANCFKKYDSEINTGSFINAYSRNKINANTFRENRILDIINESKKID